MRWYIDDIRTPPPGWTVIRNSKTALIMVDGARKMGFKIQAMSFDHDLGGDDTTRSLMYYLCEHDYWPDAIYVHSANPVGVDYLEGMVLRYAPHGILQRW